MDKMSVKIEVYVTVDSVDEARDIAQHLEEMLDDNGIINSVNVTE
jgi:hypothetical protein